jgi:predicted transcriptional regulator YdeE
VGIEANTSTGSFVSVVPAVPTSSAIPIIKLPAQDYLSRKAEITNNNTDLSKTTEAITQPLLSEQDCRKKGTDSLCGPRDMNILHSTSGDVSDASHVIYQV